MDLKDYDNEKCMIYVTKISQTLESIIKSIQLDYPNKFLRARELATLTTAFCISLFYLLERFKIKDINNKRDYITQTIVLICTSAATISFKDYSKSKEMIIEEINKIFEKSHAQTLEHLKMMKSKD